MKRDMDINLEMEMDKRKVHQISYQWMNKEKRFKKIMSKSKSFHSFKNF